MNNLLTTIIIAVCIIIIIKLLLENNKLKSNLFNNDDQIVDENKTQSVSNNQFKSFQDNSLINTEDNAKTPSKNAFLHGADNFGTMEKGLVNQGKTYANEQNKDGSLNVSVPLEYVKESLNSYDTEKIQCPQCQLQSHNLNWFEFGSSHASWKNLAGRKGFYANCPTCDIRVEYIVTKMS